MAPKVVDKGKKKRDILLAAMKVYAEKGARNARVADVARAAGVGKGTIYEYFRSRDEILIEAFHLVIGDMEEAFVGVMQTPADPETKLKQILAITFEALIQFPPDMVEIYLDFWAEGIRRRDVEGRVGINLKAMYEDFRSLLSGVLEEGVSSGVFCSMDTRLVSSSLMAVIDGLMLQLIIDRGAFDQQRIAAQTIEMMLNGLKTRTQ